MINRLFLILLSFSLFSCNENPKKQTNRHSQTNSIKSIKERKVDFNFKCLGFELVNVNTCKNDKTLFQIGHQSKLKTIQQLANTCVKYHFVQNKLKFTLIVLEFKDKTIAANIYKRISKEAKLKEGLPGLTYANDIVALNKNDRIYWFHSSCKISFKKHQEIVKCLIKKMNIKIKHQVNCICGKPVCDIIL